jgi:hypothetical protein
VPSTSKKQRNFMAAAAHNPAFAKRVGISQDVAKEFNQADKGKKFRSGGMTHDDVKQDMPMMKKVAKDEVKKHEKSMHKMAKGGVTRADGCATKGHTKGKMVAMCGGGMAKGKK